MSAPTSNPVLQATSWDIVYTILVTVGSTLFGFSWCIAYYVMNNKQIREALIGDCLSGLAKAVLSNPRALSVLTSIQARFTGTGQQAQQKQASLIGRDKVMSIPFVFQDHEHTLLVSYSRADARRDRARFSVSSDGVRTALNHCPGVPFTITAGELDCIRIETDEDEF